MVSKKSLNNKVNTTNKTKINKSTKKTITNCKNKKAIFVSQKIIVNSIFDKCLLESNVEAILPNDVSNIYNQMISDVSYINNTLTNKDYSYYGCNMGFTNCEKTISSKRQSLMEFMIQRENKLNAKVKKIKINSKSKTENNRKLNIINKKSIEILEKESTNYINIEDEKSSEVSSENNTSFRPQRKRKKPSKFKTIEDIQIEETQEDKTEEKQKSVKVEEPLVLPKLNEKEKTLEKSQKDLFDESSVQIIDLIEENSSDSSDTVKNKTSVNVEKNSKTKVYFREPVTRKPTKVTNKRLKEHTLLDKILLGINCVRKWTDKGLHLSRLCETDLALLNKRLTNLDCILADLEEHTDENNNRYLSVLLKSDLFSGFIVSATKPIDIVSPVPSTNNITSNLIKESCEYNDTSDNATYNRQKNKQHVPVMYRQRHAMPSILSKPIVRPSELKTPYKESINNSAMKCEELPFPKIKFEENLSNTDVCSSNEMQTEPQMTASQLLRIKSQKSVFDAKQIKIVNNIAQETTNYNTLTSQINQYNITNNNNNVPRDGASHSIIYQTANTLTHKYPVILLPHSKLMPMMQNNQKNQIRINISKPFQTVTKIQRIPLQNNSYRAMTNNCQQPRLSEDERQNNYPTTQSVILKNLLQQSSSQTLSPTPITTDRMVPLSVFQNSKPKRPFVPLNYHSFHK